MTQDERQIESFQDRLDVVSVGGGEDGDLYDGINYIFDGIFDMLEDFSSRSEFQMGLINDDSPQLH